MLGDSDGIQTNVPTPMMMLYIFLAENCPWCYFWSFVSTEYGKFGEWAWVGREYRDEDSILPRWSSIGGAGGK
jgi:hypothetical protein